jgi:hypothetical protein
MQNHEGRDDREPTGGRHGVLIAAAVIVVVLVLIIARHLAGVFGSGNH